MKKGKFVSILVCVLFLACSGGSGSCTVSANGSTGQVIVNLPNGQQHLLTVVDGQVTYPGSCAPPGEVVITQVAQ